jgi:WD40 repeat protein
VAFSPDGKLLAVGDGGSINLAIYDGASGRLVWEETGFSGGVWGLAWSPDGMYLATGGGDYRSSGFGEVKVWDTTTWKLRYDLKGHTECVWCVAFSPDGRRLASGAGSLQTGRPGMNLNVNSGMNPNVNSGRGSAQINTAKENAFGELMIWDLTSGTQLLTRRYPKQSGLRRGV